MSGLTRLEQETIILYNEAEPVGEVFTYNKSLQKRLNGLCEKHPEEFTCKGDNGSGAKTYYVPKKRIKVSAPRTLTKEQKEKVRQNLNR